MTYLRKGLKKGSAKPAKGYSTPKAPVSYTGTITDTQSPPSESQPITQHKQLAGTRVS